MYQGDYIGTIAPYNHNTAINYGPYVSMALAGGQTWIQVPPYWQPFGSTGGTFIALVDVPDDWVYETARPGVPESVPERNPDALIDNVLVHTGVLTVDPNAVSSFIINSVVSLNDGITVPNYITDKLTVTPLSYLKYTDDDDNESFVSDSDTDGDDNEEESSSETIETIESGKLEGKTVDTVSLLSDKTQVFKGTLTWWTWGETKTWFMEDEYKSNNLYVSKLTPASLLEQT